MNMLVAIESPIRLVASSAAGTKSAFCSPQADAMSCRRSLPGSCQFGLRTKSAVGEVVAFTSARVFAWLIFSSASAPAVTTRSQPSTRRASPVPRRAACSSPALGASLTCDITAPYFCARPDMSSTDTPLPSRWAAIARICPMVITPVPPMPVTRTPYGRSNAGICGSASGKFSPLGAAEDLPFLSRPPSTVTKLGQKPFTQEKSLLQVDWLILRLRPYSVSSGSTDRQFDLTLQSPQPSQTISLITARLAGSG